MPRRCSPQRTRSSVPASSTILRSRFTPSRRSNTKLSLIHISELEQLGAEFAGIFTNADGNLFVETYNQLNAYFATVPGNYALNLRKLYLLNTNYADLSFLFTILPGEKTNAHLGTEYLAVVETCLLYTSRCV